MAFTNLNGMIEGDLIYSEKLKAHEVIILSSDSESEYNHNDSNHSDIIVDDNTDNDEIKKIGYNVKTEPLNSSDDEIQIIEINIAKTHTTLGSVNKSPQSLKHMDESQNSSQINLYTRNSISASQINKSQNSSNCNTNIEKPISPSISKSPNNSLGNPSTGNSTSPTQMNESQNSSNRSTNIEKPLSPSIDESKNYSQFDPNTDSKTAASFHCSLCYYNTRSQENLDKHVLNDHAVTKCLACDEERENNQVIKHKFFECKFAKPVDYNTENEIKVLSDKTKKKRGRKPSCTFESLFLNKYCKVCDITKDITSGGDYSKCKDCNAVFHHECITCCKRFHLLSAAKAHVRSCNYPPQFKCVYCDHHSTNQENFIAHLECNHKQKKSEVCLKSCDSFLSMKQNESYECKSQSPSKGSKPSATSRIRKKSNTFTVLKLYCFRCQEVRENTSSILSGCQKCNNAIQFQCAQCLALFNTFGSSYRHVKRGCRIESHHKIGIRDLCLARVKAEHADLKKEKVTREKKIKCKKCPECHQNNFKPESFDAHLEQCKLLPSFQCSDCSFKSKKKQNLRAHFRNIHLRGQGYYSCSICKKKLKFSSLVKHRKQCRSDNNKNTDKTASDSPNSEKEQMHNRNGDEMVVDRTPVNKKEICTMDSEEIESTAQIIDIEVETIEHVEKKMSNNCRMQ